MDREKPTLPQLAEKHGVRIGFPFPFFLTSIRLQAWGAVILAVSGSKEEVHLLNSSLFHARHERKACVSVVSLQPVFPTDTIRRL